MENRKRTSFLSILIILICISLCVGATYAYFTDSVKSDGNIIKSGKLDVTMEWVNGTADPDAEDTVWADASTGAIFNYDLWEPGYTEVRHIRIKNVGTLAFQYKLVIVANGEVTDLADVIDVYYCDPAVQVASRTDLTDNDKLGTLTQALAGMNQTANGTLLAGESVTVTIALKMQEDAGNNYQNKSIGSDFSIQLYATQYTYESDAFDHMYDCTHLETEVIAGYPATYEATGLTDGEKCTACRKIVVQQEEILMLVEKEYHNLEFTRHVGDDGSIYYSVRGKNKYDFESTDIVIPSTYYGYPVTVIEDEAFDQFCDITSVEIPNSITTIGVEAFRSCYQMPSIEIPNSVTSIREYAFSDCGFESIELPDSVTSIGEYVFHNCGSLKSVTLPNNITSIEWGTFAYCENLTDVTIPDSVTSIDGSAFYDCFALESVAIGSGVKEIGRTAFFRCKSLESVTFDENSELTSIGNSAFIYCENLQNITIPNSVTSIGQEAFYECSSLTSITIPNGVTSIGARAFSQCTSLANVTLPDTITSIEVGTFGNCTALTSITVYDGVTSIGASAFNGCYRLTDITLPDTVTYVGNQAFYRCNLVNFPFGENSQLTSIGEWAFYYCDFKNIVIPNSVISIGERAFQNCDKLINVTLGNGLENIDFAAFGWCTALKNVTFGSNGTMSVDGGLFRGSTALTAIYITDLAAWCNIDFSSSYHFLPTVNKLYLNGELITGELVIPDNVTKIGSCTFYGYGELTSVKIGDKVTSIGWGAFEDCAALASVTIGENVTSIGSSAFAGCDSLTNAVFEQSEGWCTEYYEEDLVIVDIPATGLADPATAATFLTDTYCWDEWHRTEQTQTE